MVDMKDTTYGCYSHTPTNPARTPTLTPTLTLATRQEDATYLAQLTRKMLVALDIKGSLLAAQKRLRKLCEADFACIYRVAADVDGNQVCRGLYAVCSRA